MAQITSSGIGSGLDISGLVSQLVQSERASTDNRLNTAEVRAQAKLSAFGSLKSALTSFQTSLEKLQESGLFQGTTATVSDNEAFTVTSDSDAASANYTLVGQQLATFHKIASQGFADSDSNLGTGTLSLSVGTETLNLDINADNGSLRGIRDAINTADDNPGVSASIINDGINSYLVLSATNSGLENEITLSASTTSGDLSSFNFDPDADPQTGPMVEKQAAEDAILKVDGFAVASPNNVFDDVLEGVSITLNQADPDTNANLAIARDDNSVTGAIQQFVESYNKLRGVLDTLTAYDPVSKQAGLLQGDSTTASLSAKLRQSLSLTINGANEDMDTLAEIGITTDFETGKLTIDSEKLDGLVASNFGDFSSLFAGKDGFASQLDSIAEVYTRFDGILDNRSDGYTSQIDRINERREALNARMATVEARYLAQFTALDGLIGELNQTSSFLTSQLSNLPTFNSD